MIGHRTTRDELNTTNTANFQQPTEQVSAGTTRGADWAKDPPMLVIVVHKSGSSDTLMGDDIHGDNPVIKALARIRKRAGRHAANEQQTPVIRLWRLNAQTGVQPDKIRYYNDEQIIERAKHEGFNVSEAIAAAKATGYVAEFFKKDSAGNFIRATAAEYNAQHGRSASTASPTGQPTT